MSEKKPAGRPTGRPQGKPSGSADVFKRGEGLHTGKVGNADYSKRNEGTHNTGGDRNLTGNPLGDIGGLGQGMHSNGHVGSHNSFGGNNFGIPGGNSGSSNRSPLGGGRRSRFSLFRIILIIIVMLFLMRMMGMCGTSSYSSGDSGYETLNTPSSSTNTNSSSLVHNTWNKPSTTYEDASATAVSTTVASGARDKFTVLKGNGKDTITMLVYMCGSDLETNYGMATADLNEMLHADTSNNINILVETGGTKRWKNSVISSSTNQRWLIKDSTLKALDKQVGKKAMSDPDTLSDFIKWGTANYPADRYFLVLWDHGGGSLSGYAHDEMYPNDTMTVDEISSALNKGGVKFDWIGFDACLMANMETALAVEPYADYLIASEETEPGTGWYYTNWLNTLSKNTSLETTSLGKAIVDDFIQASYQSSSRDKTTLSLVDLAEFKGTVPQIFNEFSKEITTKIQSDDFTQIANARNQTREFASSTKIDQIDLIHFCKNIGTTSSQQLASVIQSCVKYNRCNNMTNAYGLSIYFPYSSPSQVSGAVKVYENIGMDSDYTSAIRSFATLTSSGQVSNSYNSSPLFDLLSGGSSYSYEDSYGYDSMDLLELLMGGSSSSSSYDNNYYGNSYGNSYGSGYNGYGYSLFDLLGGRSIADTDNLETYAGIISRNHVDSSNLILSENAKGQKILSLSQSEWDLIESINLNVWVDDGEGYIDLGLDPVYSFDDEGALIVDYDGTWLGLNGNVMSYYPLYEEYVSDSDYRYGYYAPILYNGERADIIFEFNNEHPDGEIFGIRPVYDNGITAKGYIEVNDGDTIDFLCDYFDYSGDYKDTYYLGNQMKVSGDLKIETLQLNDISAIYGYRLTDVYNANMWTPMLKYEN